MRKKIMRDLAEFANHLDRIGESKFANEIDEILKKQASIFKNVFAAKSEREPAFTIFAVVPETQEEVECAHANNVRRLKSILRNFVLEQRAPSAERLIEFCIEKDCRRIIVKDNKTGERTKLSVRGLRTNNLSSHLKRFPENYKEWEKDFNDEVQKREDNWLRRVTREEPDPYFEDRRKERHEDDEVEELHDGLIFRESSSKAKAISKLASLMEQEIKNSGKRR